MSKPSQEWRSGWRCFTWGSRLVRHNFQVITSQNVLKADSFFRLLIFEYDRQPPVFMSWTQLIITLLNLEKLLAPFVFYFSSLHTMVYCNDVCFLWISHSYNIWAESSEILHEKHVARWSCLSVNHVEPVFNQLCCWIELVALTRQCGDTVLWKVLTDHLIQGI